MNDWSEQSASSRRQPARAPSPRPCIMFTRATFRLYHVNMFPGGGCRCGRFQSRAFSGQYFFVYTYIYCNVMFHLIKWNTWSQKGQIRLFKITFRTRGPSHLEQTKFNAPNCCSVFGHCLRAVLLPETDACSCHPAVDICFCLWCS